MCPLMQAFSVGFALTELIKSSSELNWSLVGGVFKLLHLLLPLWNHWNYFNQTK
jgi:hypothetical protein